MIDAQTGLTIKKNFNIVVAKLAIGLLLASIIACSNGFAFVWIIVAPLSSPLFILAFSATIIFSASSIPAKFTNRHVTIGTMATARRCFIEVAKLLDFMTYHASFLALSAQRVTFFPFVTIAHMLTAIAALIGFPVIVSSVVMEFIKWLDLFADTATLNLLSCKSNMLWLDVILSAQNTRGLVSVRRTGFAPETGERQNKTTAETAFVSEHLIPPFVSRILNVGGRMVRKPSFRPVGLAL